MEMHASFGLSNKGCVVQVLHIDQHDAPTRSKLSHDYEDIWSCTSTPNHTHIYGHWDLPILQFETI